MIPNPGELLAAVAALALGYAAGSIPVAALVGRAAGVDPLADGERNPGSANVWKLAGPGWGLLALSGDLAKGALPVAVATVTWGWNAGWAAALGATLGAGWPALGRLRGGRAVAAFAGAAAALAPPAGIVGFALAGVVALGGRLLGHNTRVAAIGVAVGSYPLLFLLVHADIARLAGLLVLYLVTVARFAVTARRAG